MKLSLDVMDNGRAEQSRASAGVGGWRRGLSAFSLLEVLVACTIFFMVAFAVLELVTRSLAAARSLQQREPDPGVLAAVLSITNQLIEGSESGDCEDLFPGLYRDYTWSREVIEVSSNSLFRVDFAVYSNSRKRGPSESRMSVLMYRPGSPPGSATKGR